MPSRPFSSVATRCAQPSSEADAPASPEATSSSKRTIDALSALLGEDDAEEEERRREEEADRARAELADRVEAEKLARGERLQAFLGDSSIGPLPRIEGDDFVFELSAPASVHRISDDAAEQGTGGEHTDQQPAQIQGAKFA